MRSLADLRTEYALASLDEREVATDPVDQFARWFGDAQRAAVDEPNAMTLATCGRSGRPAARIVLLKAFDADGFVFFTNQHSAKAVDLADNPLAALVFFWRPLERQVRIEGSVETVAVAEADAYFASRPRASQIGAAASPQSQPIDSRGWLEARFEEIDRTHVDTPIPRPSHWGGYRVKPDIFEFWQGRRSRLHDRIAYRRDGARWRIVRLAP